MTTRSPTSGQQRTASSAELLHWRGGLAPALLLGASFGAGIGAQFSGYYDLSVWGWIAVVILALLAGTAAAAPVRIGGPVIPALAGLTGLALWSLLSVTWSEDADAALVEAGRWIAYAALFSLLLHLVRERGSSRLLLAGVTAGALVAIVVLLVELLTTGSGSFVGERLNEPVGYINGDAAFLLLPVWPLVAVAERNDRPALAGMAALGVAVCVGLAVLTQSRGAFAALVLASAVLVMLVPGRARRLLLLALVTASTIVLAAGPLSGISASPSMRPTDAEARSAVLAILVAGAVVGVLWSLTVAVAQKVGRESADRAAGRGLVVAAAVVLLGFAVAGFPGVSRLADRIDDQYTSFTELRPVQEQSRLLSAGGNRYDYWRVGWKQFTDRPVAGVGAGNYATTYFKERRTAETIRQAHSIEIQALGELGLVGFTTLTAFVVGPLVALVLLSSRRRPTFDAGLAVAGGGVFLIWLGQSSVDWIHLIPALTAAALCSAVALLEPWVAPATAVASRGAWTLRFAILIVSVGAAVLLIRPVLALHERTEGYRVLPADPAEALRDARDALALNDQSEDAYFLAAAAYARVNDYERAKRALEAASDLVPSDPVPWVLLGDLESRRGNRTAALASYRQALALNPRDPLIQSLLRNPPLPR